eukprot:TRINITY_DN22802_c0_g1_i1.p1 TRINITY_DN22802_c0_g1~~TRINITY_DN22802_c0_g1_i1.p1  ORF type:complete len:107 (+),score=3.05 TRINITY_DN22802_c0_g1_i1:916-1236(+)
MFTQTDKLFGCMNSLQVLAYYQWCAWVIPKTLFVVSRIVGTFSILHMLSLVMRLCRCCALSPQPFSETLSAIHAHYSNYYSLKPCVTCIQQMHHFDVLNLARDGQR